jgi:GR25 family glycosyltransferase involved in LPS biosynthesis
MQVFDKPAQMDVMFENTSSNIIELFEVKAFEINYIQKNKIIFKEKYLNKSYYIINPEIAEPFINFIQKVIRTFHDKPIYGSGIKQLCSHLLGILNVMNYPENNSKKFKLYSLCLDHPFHKKFENNLINYKETLAVFKAEVDEFLKQQNLDQRIEFYGYLPASEYIKQNEELLGKDNFNYIMKRYFF